MGLSNEALYHHFGGTDSEDYGYSWGPRRPKDASEQTPKTCRRCGETGLHWAETKDGWRLHKVAPEYTCADGTVYHNCIVIPHVCGGLHSDCTLCGEINRPSPCEKRRCAWNQPFRATP